MKTRQVLADRLRDCMARRPDLDTQVKVSKASKLAQATLSRILNAESGASIDSVDDIAKAFGVSHLELLAHTEQERRVLECWRKLGDEDKYRVQAFLEVSAQSRPGQHAGAPLNWESSAPVAPSMGAAVRRASARKTSATVKEDAEQKSSSSQRAKHS